MDALHAWVINWRTDLFPKYERLQFTKSDATREYVFKEDETKRRKDTHLVLYTAPLNI